MNRVNLLVLIDQLEALVETAPEVPLVGKVLIDADELLDLLDIIRAAVPEEIKRAEAVSSEREKMIAEGQEQVERMIAKAEEYAAKLVSNSEIYRQAEEESKLLLEESKRRAQEMQQGAEEYALEKLAQLHDVLSRALAEIERGQQALGREIFAERHQPVLVVDAGDLKPPRRRTAQRHQAVEIGRPLRPLGDAVGAHHQALALQAGREQDQSLERREM